MVDQYQRHLRLTYGAPAKFASGLGPRPFSMVSYAGEGPRIAFQAERTNRGTPDRCEIFVYNMSDELREQLHADVEELREQRKEIQGRLRFGSRGSAQPSNPRERWAAESATNRERARRLKVLSDDYRVNLFVGYGPGDPQLLFRGDMIRVSPRESRGTEDTITRIELGDTFLALRDAFSSNVYEQGADAINAIVGALDDMGVERDSETVIRALLPNAVLTKTQHGIYAVGRPSDTVDEYIELFGGQWWIHNGKFQVINQGSTLRDFSLELQEGRDLLDFSERLDHGDIRCRALLNPNIVPGRGMRLLRIDGRPFDAEGHRVNAVRYTGDTRGPQWYAEFEASTMPTSFIANTIGELTSRSVE